LLARRSGGVNGLRADVEAGAGVADDLEDLELLCDFPCCLLRAP